MPVAVQDVPSIAVPLSRRKLPKASPQPSERKPSTLRLRNATIPGLQQTPEIRRTAVVLVMPLKFPVERFLLSGVALLGCPWYVYNFAHTGSWTGLSETVRAKTSVVSSLRVLTQMDWMNVVTDARKLHIWIGNWSFLNVRTWMYQAVTWLFLLGAAGLLEGLRRRQKWRVAPVVATYAAFLAGVAYHATQIFQADRISTAAGWYLTSAIPLEAVIFVAGAGMWSRRYGKWTRLRR